MRARTIGLAVIAAVLAVVILLVQNIVFPPMESPPPALFPFFLFLAILDAVAFGVGVAFAIYLALNYSKIPAAVRTVLLPVFVIALWLSLTGWIHDGMHQSGAMPPNYQYLLVPEYLWHAPPSLILPIVLFFTAWGIARAYSKK
jgi:hypothetical protein